MTNEHDLFDFLGLPKPTPPAVPVVPSPPMDGIAPLLPPPTIKPVDSTKPEGNKVVVFTEKDVEGMARQGTPMAFQELMNIGMGCYPGTDEKTRVAALKEILDRGLGKAIQQTKVTVTHDETVRQLQQAVTGRVIDVTPN